MAILLCCKSIATVNWCTKRAKLLPSSSSRRNYDSDILNIKTKPIRFNSKLPVVAAVALKWTCNVGITLVAQKI